MDFIEQFAHQRRQALESAAAADRPSGHTYRVDPPPLTEPCTPKQTAATTADEPPPF